MVGTVRCAVRARKAGAIWRVGRFAARPRGELSADLNKSRFRRQGRFIFRFAHGLMRGAFSPWWVLGDSFVGLRPQAGMERAVGACRSLPNAAPPAAGWTPNDRPTGWSALPYKTKKPEPNWLRPCYESNRDKSNRLRNRKPEERCFVGFRNGVRRHGGAICRPWAEYVCGLQKRAGLPGQHSVFA